MRHIEPFRVMALLARARELEQSGRSIVHMEVGEPDFETPAPIRDAGVRALQQGRTQYTPAAGLPELRGAISAFYRSQQALNIAPERILITPGASGALQLVMSVLVDAGASVLMSDPGYPCNRNFVHLVGGRPTLLQVDADTHFQISAERLRQHWPADCAAVLLASPSNPSGTIVSAGELSAIHALCMQRGAHLIVDEIYHGLVYAGDERSALSVSDDLFVINSFSKYFGMTGWRLGWVVAPKSFSADLDKLAQNIFLSAPTPAQYAALAAFQPETLAIVRARKDEFQRRRDYLVPALRQLGFDVAVVPDGAFYIYAGCGRFSADSESLCHDLLEDVGVAVTPGTDFGQYRAREHVRFAYTTSMEQLEEGVRRLRDYLGK